MNNEMLLTKAQKKIAEDIILRTTFGEVVEITNAEMHKIAEGLVARGVIKVVAKKNYGHIAKVKGIE